MYRGRRGRDRMVVGFTTIYAISAYTVKIVLRPSTLYETCYT